MTCPQHWMVTCPQHDDRLAPYNWSNTLLSTLYLCTSLHHCTPIETYVKCSPHQFFPAACKNFLLFHSFASLVFNSESTFGTVYVRRWRLGHWHGRSADEGSKMGEDSTPRWSHSMDLPSSLIISFISWCWTAGNINNRRCVFNQMKSTKMGEDWTPRWSHWLDLHHLSWCWTARVETSIVNSRWCLFNQMKSMQPQFLPQQSWLDWSFLEDFLVFIQTIYLISQLSKAVPFLVWF